jgi:predicted amidohydrolase
MTRLLSALARHCRWLALALPLLAGAAPMPEATALAVAERPVKAAGDLRLALLHLAPKPSDIAGNRARIEAAIVEAANQGADWIVTPELAETGYNFAKRAGTDWIAPFPGAWVGRLAELARTHRVVLFVGLAERDAASGRLYNSVAAIDRDGRLLGTYRKQNVHGGAEDWSTAGRGSPPFRVDGIAVATLICADAWPAGPAARAADDGAAILLVPANWPDVRGMGPGDVWERRTLETGLPLIAVNRGGSEPELDFANGESVVSLNGRRLFSFNAPHGGIFYIDWDRHRGFSPVSPKE